MIRFLQQVASVRIVAYCVSHLLFGTHEYYYKNRN